MTDAVVIGRIGVDLTPSRPATSLAAADGFVRAVGGFAGNIGTGLARLGVGTAVLSAVGDDGHGEHVRTALAAEGIDVSGIATKAGARTQVAFFEAWPPDHFPVTFYRSRPAPDTLLDVADLATGGLVEDARLAVVSGALLAEDPARTALLAALERRRATLEAEGGAPGWTLLDLDWRPTLWPAPGDYPGRIAEALELSDIVVGSVEEFAAAGIAPADAATRGRARTVVEKRGPAGASIVTATGREDVVGIAVDVVCGLGAGDALTAAVGASLLAGDDPRTTIARGNAAGAIVASRLMCSSAMPTAAEIDALLRKRSAQPMEAIR